MNTYSMIDIAAQTNNWAMPQKPSGIIEDLSAALNLCTLGLRGTYACGHSVRPSLKAVEAGTKSCSLVGTNAEYSLFTPPQLLSIPTSPPTFHEEDRLNRSHRREFLA